MNLPRSTLTAGRGAQAGFTILEVILAMGVLLLGLSVILGLLSYGAALSRTAALRTTAAQEVDAVMADLEERLFPLLPDGSAGPPQPIQSRDLPGEGSIRYSASATPRPDQNEASLTPMEYRVDVDISWLNSGVRRSARFSTLLLRQVPFSQRLRQRVPEAP